MILGNNGLSRERFSEIFASLHSQLQAERKIFAPQAICLAHAQILLQNSKNHLAILRLDFFAVKF